MDGVPELRPKVAEILETLDSAIPGLKSFRDQMTHAVDDVNLEHTQFGGFVAELLPGGKVRYVLDSRYEDHEALETLCEPCQPSHAARQWTVSQQRRRRAATATAPPVTARRSFPPAPERRLGGAFPRKGARAGPLGRPTATSPPP